MSNHGIDARELVAGLSGPSLMSLTEACTEALASRGLPFPESLGAYAVTGASAPAETASSVETGASPTELINPLNSPTTIKPSVLADGRLVVIHASRSVELDDEELVVRGKPYSILALLAANADKVVGTDFLRQCSWSQPVGDQAVWQNITRIRKALGRDDLGHRDRGVIKNIWKEGFTAVTSLRGQS